MARSPFLAALVLLFSLMTGFAQAEPGEAAININTADQVTLASLDGVGESRAAAIIEYREANGPFASVQDLGQVSGIGEKTLAKNADRLTVE
ncbi:MAG: ComEA family DNA-binding protein [Marinobacter sp.]|uniref:ComEA family DNA-binding protein n=1 Tax=Marinobacter sp. TaxID=50741 RepID=UPI00299D6BF0|nr:ComEA family DNA-binding protein [Marinobacter sp.]MDX1634668.1 ComEA family DNA-binding protein [Marinobacter sp.]